MPIDPITGLWVDEENLYGEAPPLAGVTAGVIPGYGQPQPLDPAAFGSQPPLPPSGPVSAPSDVEAPGFGAPAGPPVQTGASVGFQGWTPTKSKQVKDRVGREVDAKKGAEAGRIGGMVAGQEGRLEDAFRNEERVAQNVADIESFTLEAKQKGLEARQRLEVQAEAMERLASEVAQNQVKEHRAKVEQQLAAFRAAQVDPTLNFSKGEELGNAASLFAQGFLAAGYGVNIDVTGTLDKWTDRYVENQMEKIRRGEKLLQAEQAVWDMVRTEAADEADARARVRLFTMGAAATAMEIEATRWGSEMARARGSEAAAKIRTAMAVSMNNLEMDWNDRLQASYKNIADEVYGREQLAIARYNASIAAKRLEMEKAQQTEQPRAFFSINPDPSKRQLIGIVKPGVSKEEVKEAANRFGTTQDVLVAIQNVRGLLTENGQVLTTQQALDRFTGADDKLVKAAMAQLKMALRSADRQSMGASFTKNEEALLDDQASLPTYFDRIGVEGTLRLFDNLGKTQINRAQNAMDQVLQDPVPGGHLKPWSGRVAPEYETLFSAGLTGKPPTTTNIQRKEAEIEAVQESPHQATGGWSAYIGANVPSMYPGHEAAEPWAEPMREVAREFLAERQRGEVNGPANQALVRTLQNQDNPKRADAALKIWNTINTADPAAVQQLWQALQE